jgi:hypothetical protein
VNWKEVEMGMMKDRSEGIKILVERRRNKCNAVAFPVPVFDPIENRDRVDNLIKDQIKFLSIKRCWDSNGLRSN